MDDETKILIEYMKQSKNRQKVLKSFHEDPLRPSQIICFNWYSYKVQLANV